jgi:hypothetical protein
MTPGQLIKVLLDCRMYVQKLIYWIVVILGDIIKLCISVKKRHMGGVGSGNWHRWDKKDTVEDCRSLDVQRW